ncbi:protein FAR1-RELATED SEQUENCE 5-like [Ipomoea triloba]|uniref:protein FAR1-RELATED SEQUENCE 5-like n=1 Tax=Ipomoea triloba TaxID=35885 RepID=UPI00125E9546|nr:protein FAR1-RELATED SEQUENCE 5-like [Ipomoea triloba]
MDFTPFTGIHNHKKNITFATGLLTKEDIASYVWLFEHFKKAMGAEPKVIITDQDPAMRQAIPVVFNEARHRFCMWHIMCKVGEKIGYVLSKNDMFRKKLNSVAWSSYLEPLEFENEWKPIMEEFDLVNNNWFVQMFELRRFWIPAYFRDVPMAGLLRTTSLSEEQADLSPTHRKNAVIECYCESSKPSEISILPSRKANKGSGKHMKGKKELAMDTSKKGLRTCHMWDTYLENDKRHDSMNCPLRKELTDEED